MKKYYITYYPKNSIRFITTTIMEESAQKAVDYLRKIESVSKVVRVQIDVKNWR